MRVLMRGATKVRSIPDSGPPSVVVVESAHPIGPPDDLGPASAARVLVLPAAALVDVPLRPLLAAYDAVLPMPWQPPGPPPLGLVADACLGAFGVGDSAALAALSGAFRNAGLAQVGVGRGDRPATALARATESLGMDATHQAHIVLGWLLPQSGWDLARAPMLWDGWFASNAPYARALRGCGAASGDEAIALLVALEDGPRAA